MKHCCFKLGIAGGLTAGIMYSIKSAFLYFAREKALTLWAAKHYMSNVTEYASKLDITIANFGSGLLQSVVCGALLVSIFAYIYKQLCPCQNDKSHFSENKNNCNSGSCR